MPQSGISELVSFGKRVNRLQNPSRRLAKWQEWRDKLKLLMTRDSELGRIGLKLTFDSFKDDLRTLLDYGRPSEAKDQVPGSADRRPRRRRAKLRTVNVFVSHKHEDAVTAVGIRNILARYDRQKRLRFFLSEDIPEGTPWVQWIERRLVESHILLLLFTDPTRSWDWCLYEAGLFDRLKDEHRRRIICLHSTSTKPPKPLQHLQAVAAIPARIKRFLQQLYLETGLTGLRKPIAPFLADLPHELDNAAKEIAVLVDREPVKTRYLGRHIFLHIPHTGEITPERIPPDAVVTSDGASAFEVFDMGPGEWRWKDLEQGVLESTDVRWLEELARAADRVKHSKAVRPPRTMLRSHNKRAVYRALLYQADWEADGTLVLRILLAEQFAWQLADIDTRIGTLLNALVMGVRFRYEVLERLASLGGDRDESGLSAEVREEIQAALLKMEAESESHGLLKQEHLVDAFKDNQERQAISQMFAAWFAARPPLREALSGDERIPLAEIISTLTRVSTDFLQLASRRLHDLIVQQTTRSPPPADMP